MELTVMKQNSEKQSIVETYDAHTKVNLLLFSQTQVISKTMLQVTFADFGKVIVK
jgi:hypothetical protein